VAAALRRWRTPAFRVAVVLAVVGLIGAYPRPDTPHLAFVVPLAAPRSPSRRPKFSAPSVRGFAP
jgi:hypothetical protein